MAFAYLARQGGARQGTGRGRCARVCDHRWHARGHHAWDLAVVPRAGAAGWQHTRQARWAARDNEHDAGPCLGRRAALSLAGQRHLPRGGTGAGARVPCRVGRASPDGTAPPVADDTPTGIGAKDVDALPLKGGALEIQIAEDDTIDVGFLHSGSLAARSVAKVLVVRSSFRWRSAVDRREFPDYGNGTGWLIAPSLLITNYHVVGARGKREPAASEADFALQAAATQVQFDYHNATSAIVEVQASGCEASDPGARLRAAACPQVARQRRGPATAHPAKGPDHEAEGIGPPRTRQRAPASEGRPDAVGFPRQLRLAASDLRVSYLTDTTGARPARPSAMTPWLVAGLHRGFDTIEGGPLVVWGKTSPRELRHADRADPNTSPTTFRNFMVRSRPVRPPSTPD